MYSAVIDRSDFRQDIAVAAVFYQLRIQGRQGAFPYYLPVPGHNQRRHPA